MADFLSGLMRFVLQLALVVFALIFVGSLLLAAALLAGVWSLRALWSKITGRPIAPWSMRMSPGAGWNQVFRAGERWTPAGRAARGAATPSARRATDVTDVQVKEITGH
ncbi:hypothetical protein [Variovorax sp. HJSM1_2]|uniref:hypothetical protein n=1 Tax=Variovorax sp. HJSM1_2 TaxID=3366263 RepID=UPI003BC231ED